eukprot:scaffold78213_cov28-Attheya_sp.AAC.2
MAPFEPPPDLPVLPTPTSPVLAIPTRSGSPKMSASNMALTITNGSARHTEIDDKMEQYSKNATNKNTIEFDPKTWVTSWRLTPTPTRTTIARVSFSSVLKGDKTDDKKIILNKAIKLIVLLWVKKDGNQYEPNSWVTMTSVLFFFVSEYGIEFKVEDFSYHGGWNTTIMHKVNDFAKNDGTRTYGSKHKTSPGPKLPSKDL